MLLQKLFCILLSYPKLDHELREKWKKEKEEISTKATKLAEDLIQAGQRYHTPNKYLTEDDIYELSEQIMALVVTNIYITVA